MICIRVFRNAKREATGFRSEGHAEYDDPGRDIICAAVSVLELNLANSVSGLTDARFSCEVGEEGSFFFSLPSRENEKAALLLDSCLLGLEAIREEYGSNYLTISDQEV